MSTADLNVNSQEENDLRRYLDATRSELLFAKGVILVEGMSELLLLPAFVKRKYDLTSDSEAATEVDAGFSVEEKTVSLDQFGVTICSIGGVGFLPYAKLLSSLEIPFVVVTDGDEYLDRDGSRRHLGLERCIGIAGCLDNANYALMGLYKEERFANVEKRLEELGLFVSEHTFEAELLLSGYRQEFLDVFEQLGAGAALMDELRAWTDTVVKGKGKGEDMKEAVDEVLKRIVGYPCYGKGRFAQGLAQSVDSNRMPTYLSNALQHIVAQVQQR